MEPHSSIYQISLTCLVGRGTASRWFRSSTTAPLITDVWVSPFAFPQISCMGLKAQLESFWHGDVLLWPILLLSFVCVCVCLWRSWFGVWEQFSWDSATAWLIGRALSVAVALGTQHNCLLQGGVASCKDTWELKCCSAPWFCSADPQATVLSQTGTLTGRITNDSVLQCAVLALRH